MTTIVVDPSKFISRFVKNTGNSTRKMYGTP
uniref:Uncharacterized protein n=1 Tax=Rhizophora mucronata TaxID=61149 RepID=A0A2P2IQE8_RHIMU